MDAYGAYTFDSHTAANHGCAINSNLAAMVADPEHLIHGQPGTGLADPRNAARAISAYRRAAPTGGGGTAVESSGTSGTSGAGGASSIGANPSGTAGN